MKRRHAPGSRSVNRCRPRIFSLEGRILLSGVDVTQYHNDPYLSGANLNETVLTPANVNSTDFGLLFSQPVDGYVYAQPLYMSGLTINGAVHNVVFIATENDTVYAFDADSNAGADAQPLWVHSFANPAAGITAVPSGPTQSHDIVPVVGITGTPVIDPATNTLYVVTKTEVTTSGSTLPTFVQTLHALAATTGADKFVSVGYVIGQTVYDSAKNTYVNTTAITAPGTGEDSTGGVVSFNALRENQRSALQLDGNWILVMWASHGDNQPYHGWVVAFNKTTLQPVAIFNTTPNGSEGGIWESGDAAAYDPATGAIDFATGNGTFDEYGASPANDYGESVVRLNPTPVGNQFVVQDFFTPYTFQTLNNNDADLGSGGTMLLPDSVGSAAHPHLMVETGKSGIIYLIDRDDMGKVTNPGTGPDDVVQEVTAGEVGVWGSPAFLQVNSTTGIIFYHGAGSVLKGFYITNGHIEDGSAPGDHAILLGSISAGFPGTQPVISANGTINAESPTNAIVWELQVDQYGTSGPAILRAYNPTQLATQYYSSAQSGLRDQLGGAVKFTVPTVADGNVYVGSQFQFSVFGPFPASTTVPAAPANLAAQTIPGTSIEVQLNWTNPAPAAGAAATGIEVLRSTDGVDFTTVTTLPASATSFTDPGPFTTGQIYTYELVAVNQVGSSHASGTAKVNLTIGAAVLSITNVTASTISLSWSAVANNQYAIEQSTDGVNFTTIATVPASRTTYTVTGLAPGIYAYRIGASSINPPGSSVSNVQGVTVGAVIDQSAGFSNTSALTANGSAQFAEGVARITNADDQTGSVFTNNPITIGSFTTSFTIRFHEGTQPNYADGITFVIQADSPTALGLGSVGMGYKTIGNSIAIKLDTFQNPGDPSDSSTGLSENGAAPSGGLDTTANNGPLLNSQDPKLVSLSYNGTALTETITDTLNTQATFTASYNVNIPAVIGSDTAYVGFTGATGDSDYWELQDVTSWLFTSTEPLPGAPTNLHAARSSPTQINLSWTSNSYNETGFAVERAMDGSHFTQIGTTTGTTYQDTTVGAGPYQYRVVAFNANGNSPSSNTAVVQATPTITWNGPASITYGTALSATQLDAMASVPGSFTYTPAAGTILTVGKNQTLSVQFTPTDTTDYTTANATTRITVGQATPKINWNTPASITYGTALSATQLDAASPVAGTFSYAPPAGTILTVGKNQTLSVHFTPTDSTDYTTANATTTITVLQAPPKITWNTPASITYGTALSPTQLDATSPVAGTFSYAPVAGTVLHAGNNQTLSVMFTPADTTDYASNSASAAIDVTPASLAIKVNNQTMTYGGAPPTPIVSYSGLVNGDTPAVFDAAGHTAPSTSAILPNLPAGSYPLTASGASEGDYTITYIHGTLTVTPAPLTIAANDVTMYAGQSVPDLTASYSSFVDGDAPSSLSSPPVLSTTATSASPAGVYAIVVGGASSPNYAITYISGSLTVDPALITLEHVSIKNKRVGFAQTTPVIVLQFSGPLTAADASTLRNYSLVTVPKVKNHKSKPVSLFKAQYNSSQHTVTLRTRKKLVLARPLQLTISSPGLLDSLGRPLGGGLVVTLGKHSGKIATAVRASGASVPVPHAVDALLEQGWHLSY
jgi:hypothetical protein